MSGPPLSLLCEEGGSPPPPLRVPPSLPRRMEAGCKSRQMLTPPSSPYLSHPPPPLSHRRRRGPAPGRRRRRRRRKDPFPDNTRLSFPLPLRTCGVVWHVGGNLWEGDIWCARDSVPVGFPRPERTRTDFVQRPAAVIK